MLFLVRTYAPVVHVGVDDVNDLPESAQNEHWTEDVLSVPYAQMFPFLRAIRFILYIDCV